MHTRNVSENENPPPGAGLSQPASIESITPTDTSSVPTVPTTGPASTSATSQSWDDEAQPEQQQELPSIAQEMDFALTWPDSEELFQSLMSSDATDQWQMPLGTLPFPPIMQDVNGMNFESPNSFDDRTSSVGTIPSGGGHQAVRDVTEMVTSSVSRVPHEGDFNFPPHTYHLL